MINEPLLPKNRIKKQNFIYLMSLNIISMVIMKIKKHFTFITLIIIALAILSGCTQQTTDQAGEKDVEKASQGTITVSIKDFKFNPAAITITKGTKVTWVNEDSAPHTATSEGSFDSGTLSKDQSFSDIFAEAGTFDYKCSIHPSMKGKVIVA